MIIFSDLFEDDDKMMAYFINNILNPIHIIIELLLILSWNEWVIFSSENNKYKKRIKSLILSFLFIIFLILIFNIIIYFQIDYFKDDDIMNEIYINNNKWYRNGWFIVNIICFLIILFIIGSISIYKLIKTDFKYLALRKMGENKVLKNFKRNNDQCFCRLFSYLSLTIFRFFINILIINLLSFIQSGLWLYLRYIDNKKHYEIRNNHLFQIIIFITDFVCILLCIILIFFLRKQRLNYEEIKEINNSERRIDRHFKDAHTQDIHGLDGFNTNIGSPIL